jgi:hypothetical protein
MMDEDGQVDTPGGEVPAKRQSGMPHVSERLNVHREDARGGEHIPMYLQKLRPAHTCPASYGGRADVMATQDVTHGNLVDMVPQVRQRPLETAVTPGGIFFRHAHHQLFDLGCNAWSSERLPRRCPMNILDDETAIPTLEGVRCCNRRDVLEALSVDRVRQHRQATTLGIGEATLLPVKFGFQDAVFLTEIGDDLILVAMDPAGKDGDQGLEDDHGRS